MSIGSSIPIQIARELSKSKLFGKGSSSLDDLGLGRSEGVDEHSAVYSICRR